MIYRKQWGPDCFDVLHLTGLFDPVDPKLLAAGLFRHYKLRWWWGGCWCVQVDDQAPAGFVFSVNVGAVKGWRGWPVSWLGQDGFLYMVDGYLIRFNPAQVRDCQ